MKKLLALALFAATATFAPVAVDTVSAAPSSCYLWHIYSGGKKVGAGTNCTAGSGSHRPYIVCSWGYPSTTYTKYGTWKAIGKSSSVYCNYSWHTQIGALLVTRN